MRGVFAASALVGVLLAALPAGAGSWKAARCATTDDGAYDCRFRFTDRQGSFEIVSPGKPTYALEIVEPGVAFGFVTLEDHAVALPGRFLRSAVDRACWINDATQTRVCAW